MSQTRELVKLFFSDIHNVLATKLGSNCLGWILNSAGIGKQESIKHLLTFSWACSSRLSLLGEYLSLLLNLVCQFILISHLGPLLFYLNHRIHILHLHWEVGPLLCFRIFLERSTTFVRLSDDLFWLWHGCIWIAISLLSPISVGYIYLSSILEWCLSIPSVSGLHFHAWIVLPAIYSGTLAWLRVTKTNALCPCLLVRNILKGLICTVEQVCLVHRALLSLPVWVNAGWELLCGARAAGHEWIAC